MKELDQIKARAEAATPGPWETTQAADEESTTWIESPNDDILHHDERGHGHMRENFAWIKRADAEFIAHARTDVPRLLRALESAGRVLQGRAEQLKRALDEDADEVAIEYAASAEFCLELFRGSINDTLGEQ